MNCNELRDNLSLYIDDELSEEEKILLEEHLTSCPECSRELDEYKKIIQIVNQLPDEEPPAGYCKRLHEKLLNTELTDQEVKKEDEVAKITDINKKKKNNKFRWMKYGSIAAAFVLIVLVYGFNNNGFKMGKSSNQINYDTSDVAPAEESKAEEFLMESNYGNSMAEIENEAAINDRAIGNDVAGQVTLIAREKRDMKIIKTGSIYSLIKDYDKFLDDITAKIESLGGYIEFNNTEVYQVYENEKLMHGTLKIRVPQENFYEIVSYLEERTEIRRKNINEKDVTKEYYEKDNKVKNLEIQEQHLRDLFEKATTVEEMLQIENELRRIRTEIDGLNISLSDINERTSMSTIDLEVEEVKEVNFTLKSEENVWERAREGFINTINSIVRSIENLIVNLISSSPVLIPAIVIFIILLGKIKKYWKKKL